MGLVEGENLSRRLLREDRLTPEAVDRLLFPLLDGLEKVHGIGFLHRDTIPRAALEFNNATGAEVSRVQSARGKVMA